MDSAGVDHLSAAQHGSVKILSQGDRIRYKLTTETIFIIENPRSIGHSGCY